MAPNTTRHQEIDYSIIEVENQAIKSTNLKAMRADDAPIDFEIWAWPNETESQTRARDLLCYAGHLFWRQNLMREASLWLHTSPNAIPAETRRLLETV
jgi:hypothetical protein